MKLLRTSVIGLLISALSACVLESAILDTMGLESSKTNKEYVSPNRLIDIRSKAEGGDPEAQNQMGIIYGLGKAGQPINQQKAFNWYLKAAKAGHFRAQFNVATRYDQGIGAFQDKVIARAWYVLSAIGGNETGGRYRDLITRELSVAEVRESNVLAQRWKTGSDISRLNANVDKPKNSIETPEGRSPSQSISGSGFFVSKMGHVVTNAHVVKGCSRITVGDSADKQTPAEIVNSDNRKDLALLEVSSFSMASAETKALISKLEVKLIPLAAGGLLRYEDVKLGEKVMVAGYPYGDIFSNSIKVTRGIVSAVRGMGDDTSQFQLDAAAQAGNSGGPIYDESGNIVGVVVSQLNKLQVAKAMGSLPENVNFGIKASTVRQFLTSSGLPSKWAKRETVISTKELALTAQQQTLMVMCHQ